MRSLPLTLIALLTLALHAAAETFTQADLLRRMIDLDRLTLPPDPQERAGLFSSFDRASRTADDGGRHSSDADQDAGHFIREEDGWGVMAEMEGPGVINRVWTNQPAGQLRIVLDDNTVYEGEFARLFDGSVEPFNAPFVYQTAGGGGYVLCFPIGYGRQCRILSRDFAGRYQIDYTALPASAAVDTFSPTISEQAAEARETVARAFRGGFTDRDFLRNRPTMLLAKQAAPPLPPGGKLTDKLDESGTIRALFVTLTDRNEPRDPYVLHQCVLRIWWDGSASPAVEAPLTDFFGAGFDRQRYASFPMGTNLWTDMPFADKSEGWFMYCYFPMPYRDGFRIEIENLSDAKLGLMLYMRVDRSEPPAESLRFNARYRRESECKTGDYPLLETAGRGRYVGTVLSVDCPRSDWWGEGDHKVWVDDPAFPALWGTDTAGYFGDAAPLHLFRRALHGVTLTGPFGKSSAYRWHVADCINFQRMLRFSLENRQVDRREDVDYASVAYWYGQPGAPVRGFERLTAEYITPFGLRIPGSVEIEANLVGAGWGNLVRQRHAGGVEFSGGYAVSLKPDTDIQARVRTDQPGRYKLRIRIHPRRPFEKLVVSYDDGRPIGTVEYSRREDGLFDVGEVELGAGETRLLLRGSGAVVADCWMLVPLEP